MGDIIPPTGSGPPKIEIIKYKGKSLKLSLYETEGAYTIFIGGHNKFCIDCLIEKKSDSAYLSHIYSNVECSLERNFRGGHDTKAIMFLLMSYIKNNFPFVKEIQLTDVSNKECNNGATVQLYEMSYITTGKSWYERNFGAMLKPDAAVKFAREDANFQKKKHIIGWEGIKIFMRGELPIEENEMRDMFEQTNTWQEFFGWVSDKVGMAKFCEFVAPWLQAFLFRNFKFQVPFVNYYISLDTYTPNTYTLEGGKRQLYTSKRSRT
jgi:hypothetical protein